jgi:sortase A
MIHSKTGPSHRTAIAVQARPGPAGRRGRRHKGAIATFLLALSAFLALGGGAVMLLAPDSHAAPQRSAEADTATPSGTPAPPNPASGEFALLANAPVVPRPGMPNRLVIPSIALDAPVAEVGLTIDNGKPAWETAAFAVGYYRGTALPGDHGNTVMAGHISSPVSKKGDIFRHLPDVRVGDRIQVFVGDRAVTYEVAEVKVVPPTAVQVMAPSADPILTLITCYPDGVYSSRLVVVSKLVQSGAGST